MSLNRMFLTGMSWVLTLCAAIGVTACHQKPAPTTPATTARTTSNPVQFVAARQESVSDQLTLGAKVQADPARSFRVLPPGERESA